MAETLRLNKDQVYLFRDRVVRYLKDCAPPYPAHCVLVQFLNGGLVAVAKRDEVRSVQHDGK